MAVAASVTLIGTAALAQHAAGHNSSMDKAATEKMMTDMMPKETDAGSTKEFKQVHLKMMKDMHQTFTGKADVDFVTGMIPHHQGAIDMAKVQLAHGKDPEIRKMAEKIIADQEKEIAEMQAWLKKNAK
jgi:uncharacterized protein (DUF305 family)